MPASHLLTTPPPFAVLTHARSALTHACVPPSSAGLFSVSVQIDGLHVIGSPAQMRLSSGVPDLERTALSGTGLTQAVAGRRETVHLQCLDACGNMTLPDESCMRFGITLLPEAERSRDPDAWRAAPPHAVELSFNADDESLELRYVAESAGELLLYVWADDQSALHAAAAAVAAANAHSKGEGASTSVAPDADGGTPLRLRLSGSGGADDADGGGGERPVARDSRGKHKLSKGPRMSGGGGTRLTAAEQRRQLLPGGPFKLLVMAAKANTSGSYIAGISREVEEKISIAEVEKDKNSKTKP
jgi:hypothetical protein